MRRRSQGAVRVQARRAYGSCSPRCVDGPSSLVVDDDTLAHIVAVMVLVQVDPSRLNAIADEIDDEALAEEEGDEGDDGSSSSSDDEEGEDGDDEDDDEIMERLDQGDEDEGDLWRATEAHEREAAKNIEIDMSHIELTDDKKQQ